MAGPGKGEGEAEEEGIWPPILIPIPPFILIPPILIMLIPPMALGPMPCCIACICCMVRGSA